MVDVTSIGAALTSIKTASDIAKLIKNSAVSLEQAEIKLQIAELVSSLADAKIEIAEVQNLLISKDNEIVALRKELELKGNIQYEKPYYWVITGDDKDGPFCQHCYDVEGKLIRLQSGATGSWNCHSCKGYFRDKNYRNTPITFG